MMGVYYSHYLIPQDNTVRPSADSIVALIKALIERGFLIQPQDASDGDTPYNPFAQSGACFVAQLSNGEILERKRPSATPKGFWQRLASGPEKTPRYFDKRLPFPLPPVGQALSCLEAPYAMISFQGGLRAADPLQTVTYSAAQGKSRCSHKFIIEISDDFLNPPTDVYSEAKQLNPICVCGNNLKYQDILGPTKIRHVCPICGIVFRPQDQVAEIVNGADGSKRAQPGGLCHRFGILIDFGNDYPNYRRSMDGTIVEIDIEPKTSSEFLDTCTTALGFDLNEFSYFT